MTQQLSLGQPETPLWIPELVFDTKEDCMTFARNNQLKLFGKSIEAYQGSILPTNLKCIDQNLMNELGKVKKVMQKVVPDAPHEILLVLDASTGQNAIEQAKQFTLATDVNALALTKLDGTAKGGVAIGVSDQFKIPIKYIGVGEGIEDLQPFNKSEFVDSLFK